MNYLTIIDLLVNTTLLLLLASCIVAFFRSRFFKGFAGEAAVKISSSRLLDKNEYKRLHNVMLRTPDGTTQIDHIFVSRFGVFVVETKNYTGWIFGSVRDRTWTKNIYGHIYRFQNPLRQSYKHKKAVERVTGVHSGTIFSVVVFTGTCTLKTPMPPNVCKGGAYAQFIKSKTQVEFSDDEVEEIVSNIEAARIEPSSILGRTHKWRLRRLGASDSRQLCPKCGSVMVIRVSRRGRNAESKFWGCSKFPECRGIRQIAVGAVVLVPLDVRTK